MKKVSVVDAMGELIYGIRWGLVPMYLMLWVAIIAYNVQFAREIFDFLFVISAHGIYFRENDSTHYLLWILSLIDITMIGNLVVMTTVGGWSTFIKEFNLAELDGKPRWMNGLDSTTLKNKMGMSLVGVSAIHLLKTFMELAEKASNMTMPMSQITVLGINVLLQVLIHVVFIATTLAFAYNAKLMHGHKPAHPNPNEGSH